MGASVEPVCVTNQIEISEVPVENIFVNNTETQEEDNTDVSQKGTEAASGTFELSTNSLIGIGALMIIVLAIGFLIGRGRNGPPPFSSPAPEEFVPNLPMPPQINRYESQPIQQIPSFDPSMLK